jgi:putative acyl-CoA dehydrogenase
MTEAAGAPGPGAGFRTHQVFNQPPPLADYDLFATDRPLVEALTREGAGWAAGRLGELGRTLGRAATIELGFQANRNPPILKAFDRFGHRRDAVEFHPAWHDLMGLAVAEGLHTGPWADPRPGAHVARAAGFYMLGQVEAGVQCPMAMTYGAAAVLGRVPPLAAEWLPRLFSRRYDPGFRPAGEKLGALMGMGLTEKQGGSDLRSNTTRAEPAADGETYRLVGHKWFFSAPMSDGFLVLAQAGAGLSCFLLPRFAPDGALNAVRIQRLKDKLGDWSNASAEVEFQGALAWMIGEPGRGVATILQMVALTRQDCVIGSASIMRQALVQAVHHARHRRAFGKPLSEQPLMLNVLADLALESEASTALALRIARAVDASARDAKEAALARIVSAIGKYWVCKRCPPFVNEAQECLGGNGYVEESILPRLYRQAPLNSIWEGSGNIQCLDVLRALAKEPASAEAYFAELESVRGGNDRLDAEIAALRKGVRGKPQDLEARSRRIVERMAIALQASCLIRGGNVAIADSFCDSRLGREHGIAFGTLPSDAPVGALLERALSG